MKYESICYNERSLRFLYLSIVRYVKKKKEKERKIHCILLSIRRLFSSHRLTNRYLTVIERKRVNRLISFSI